MNDLFSKALTAIPVYMGQVLGLLSGPKRFVLARDLETDQAATEAYTFLGVTIFLTLIAEVSMLPEQKDYLLTFASFTVVSAINLTLMSGALYFAWRIVGGTLSLRTFFIVSCYFSGISTLIFAVFTLLGSGVLRIVDPETAAILFNGGVPADRYSVGFAEYSAIVGVGFIAVYIWIFVVWGAYRRLDNVSRERSAIALTVFLLVSPLLLGVQTIMSTNIMASRDVKTSRTTQGHLPADLPGLWKSGDIVGPDRAPPTEASTYSFSAAGDYFSIHTSAARQGACLILTQENANGQASIDGPLLILAQKTHSVTVVNSCSSQKTEKPWPVETEAYAYEIRHQATGWLLCLSGRYHQECLAARAN